MQTQPHRRRFPNHCAPLEAMRLRFHEQLTVNELASMAAMSVSSFRRQFKAATGTSPKNWSIENEMVFGQRKETIDEEEASHDRADPLF